jgi:uncharacterized protein YkwD
MQLRLRTAAIALSVGIAGSVAGLGLTPSLAGAAPGDTETEFLRLHNTERQNRGMSLFTRDAALDAVARDWAQKLAVHDPSIDADPKCVGKVLCHRTNLRDAVASVEPAWQRGGENVGVGGDAAAIFNAFLNSPAHFANIAGNQSDYNRIGIGVVEAPCPAPSQAITCVWVAVNFLKGPAISGPTGIGPDAVAPVSAPAPAPVATPAPPAPPVQAASAPKKKSKKPKKKKFIAPASASAARR